MVVRVPAMYPTMVVILTIKTGDLTNAQFPMFNSQSGYIIAASPFPGLRIEHWELSIGQIPLVLKTGFIFELARTHPHAAAHSLLPRSSA
jgi:hypothetical protein